MAVVNSDIDAKTKARPSVPIVSNEDEAILRSDKIFYRGDAGEVEDVYDSTRKQAEIKALAGGFTIDAINLGDRIVLTEHFKRAAKANADIQNAAEGTRMIANPDFEVAGTNMTSALSTIDSDGGNKLTTAGADNDQAILQTHKDANQSAWEQVNWNTDKEVRFRAPVVTAADITNAIIWLGLKLTNTPTKATDDDQAVIRYENGVNGGKFEAVDSNGGTDDVKDTGITVAASTVYHIVIIIGSDKVPKYYINGTLVATGKALKANTNLKLFAGVQASGEGAAKTIIVRHVGLSRKF